MKQPKILIDWVGSKDKYMWQIWVEGIGFLSNGLSFTKEIALQDAKNWFKEFGLLIPEHFDHMS